MPEPDAVKVARPVLRRGRASNRSFLFNYLFPKGRNSVRSNDDKEGIGESKKRMTIGNRLYRGLKIASIRKDADLLYGVLLYERRYDL